MSVKGEKYKSMKAMKKHEKMEGPVMRKKRSEEHTSELQSH